MNRYSIVDVSDFKRPRFIVVDLDCEDIRSPYVVLNFHTLEKAKAFVEDLEKNPESGDRRPVMSMAEGRRRAYLLKEKK